MAVKDKIGRRRYIAFRIQCDKEIQENDLIRVVREKCSKENKLEEIKPWILRFENNQGLLRCSHLAKERAIEMLMSINEVNGVKVNIETLGTSGTIRSAVRKYLY